MLNWNPSYDFDLFDIRDFSPLQMQEFGAQTEFRANDPTGYVDFALNQLRALTSGSNPYPYMQRQYPTAPIVEPAFNFFQTQQGQSAADIRGRLQQIRDEADRMLREAGGQGGDTPCKECTNGEVAYKDILGICRCGKVMKNDGDTQLATPGSQKVADTAKVVKDWLTALPGGSMTFLIAIFALIFLILFARR